MAGREPGTYSLLVSGMNPINDVTLCFEKTLTNLGRCREAAKMRGLVASDWAFQIPCTGSGVQVGR